LAVRPAPLLTGSFSPRPTLRDTPFFAITLHPCICEALARTLAALASLFLLMDRR
jgi:hypothetical protein